jgi:hypothetical protein
VEHFRNRFGGFSLSVERVLPRAVLETLMSQGVVKTIRLVKKVLPTDLAQVFSDKDLDKISEVELVVRTKRQTAFTDINWLLDSIESKKRPSEIVTIPSFEQDNIKLEMVIDGRSRVVDLGNPGKLSSNIELPNLHPDINGHPKAREWLTEADKLASGIVRSWGVRNITWDSRA